MYSRVPVVIPSYEPDDRLPQLCRDLYAAGIEDIILIDDGSGPRFRAIFDGLEKEYPLTVLRHAVNLGKGRALKDAFNYLLNRDEAMIGCVTADSDGQHTPADIGRMIAALEEHPDSLILGCRDFDADNVPFKSKAGNKITCRVCKWIAGVGVSDTQTGLRAIPRDFMAYLLGVAGERFEFEMNMLVETRDRCPVREIKIETVYDSKENHTTHFHPVRDSIRIYRIFGAMFLKFVFSSLSASVVDLAAFHFLSLWLQPLSPAWYITIATVAARILSSLYNYTVNYVFVFESNENKGKSLVKYYAVAAAKLALSALLVTLGSRIFPGTASVVIKMVVDTALFFAGYRIQRELVF